MGKKAEDAGAEMPADEKLPVGVEEDAHMKDRWVPTLINLYCCIIERRSSFDISFAHDIPTFCRGSESLFFASVIHVSFLFVW